MDLHAVGCEYCGEFHVYVTRGLAEYRLKKMREGDPFGNGENIPIHDHTDLEIETYAESAFPFPIIKREVDD